MFGMGTGVAPALWTVGKPSVSKTNACHSGNSRIALERAPQHPRQSNRSEFHSAQACPRDNGQASRAISTGQLHALLRFHLRPINLLVSERPSVTEVKGDLILGLASHLDAFSGYPFQT